MIRHVVLGVVLGGSVVTAQAPAADDWKDLRFLLGTWDAKTEGGAAGATAAGRYLFRLELGGHVLARHTATAACKGPDDFDCEHGDLLYVYRESPGGPVRAEYFDNEGHVIHYAVTTPAPDTAQFLSPAAAGPGFRLVYELKDGVMRGRFDVQMPGQPEFRTYLAWTGRRR